MPFTKFIWIPLYVLAALIDHFASGFPFVESLIAVFPAFIVGLIPSVLAYFLFMRRKWSWYHVLNLGAAIMVMWVLVNS